MLIKKEQIIEWSEKEKFQDDKHAEKDLYIESLLKLFSFSKWLLKHLIFKGGTALHKMHFEKSLRFSEDIDFEHKGNQDIGRTLNEMKLIFGKANLNIEINRNKNNYEILCSYPSHTTTKPGKLKIEISDREDFSVLGYTQKRLHLNNVCFSSDIMMNTYNINEILSQKTRALYQRDKGRDLYDLYVSRLHPDFDMKKIAQCFIRHMTVKKDGKAITNIPTAENFIKRLKRKEKAPHFLRDVHGVLKTDVEYNQKHAFEWIKEKFVPNLIKECIRQWDPGKGGPGGRD
ncbi:MAG: nucleotidyl transferase AbiEii/AbiGii toxin family protein [Flavobacteriaceae bacterium]|nr:nucleotidyl transferase AbiEii/AbiGii toxin family protein [Flavobacteriaceae bacterium]